MKQFTPGEIRHSLQSQGEGSESIEAREFIVKQTTLRGVVERYARLTEDVPMQTRLQTCSASIEKAITVRDLEDIEAMLRKIETDLLILHMKKIPGRKK